MKIRILTDNHTFIDQYYLGEPGFSLLFEEEGRKYLFDTGYSDVFLKNAEKMGIGMKDLSAVILSHGHNDHTGGLRYLLPYVKETVLIAHPDVFEEKTDMDLPVGCPVAEEELRKSFREVLLSKEPVFLAKDLCFLGEVPRYYGHEGKGVGLHKREGSFVHDPCPDDSGMAYIGKDGLWVFTGCAHSGIMNTIRHAKEVTGADTVKGVLGGFHLMEEGEELKRTIELFSEEKVEKLYPCHCVSLRAKAEMIRAGLDIYETGVGLTLELE